MPISLGVGHCTGDWGSETEGLEWRNLGHKVFKNNFSYNFVGQIDMT